MIFHYFKVAFRSYINNKIQSAITLFSMAIAFALASIAAYWIHYEKTYDSFIADSERIYMIGQKIPERTSINSISFYGLHSHLMNNFPEVDKACGIKTKWKADRTVAINKQIVLAGCEEITPETIEMFDIQWVDGNRDMNSWKENEVAVSEQIVRQTCGKDSPIGEKLVLLKDDGMEIAGEYQIAAVFKTWPQHSNFNFQILKKYVPTTSVYKVNTCYAYVCLKPDTDVDLFLNKMIANPFINELGIKKLQNVLVPLSELHYTVFGRNQDIRLNDVKLFAGAAMLLSVCALLNYLTLFVSRLRNRGRDMALRTICGSSSWQTGILLMVEYLFLLLGALILSIFFIELFYNVFVKLSQLDVDRITVYAGCGYLLLFILILAVVLSFVPILYFKNKTLRGQIDSTPVRLGRNRFRIAGVCMQLFISLLFIFCSTVMIKQIHYLIHADINIERKNIAWIVAPL